MQRGLRIFLGASLILPSLMAVAHAESMPDLFITEIQTSSASSGSQEFIELYNNTDSDVDLADTLNNGQDAWKIEYFSSTKVVQSDFSWDSTSPSGEIALTGTVPAHDYYLLSTAPSGVTYSPENVEPDQTYATPHLANTAGGVQLVDDDGTTLTSHDSVGWSDADVLVNDLYASPPAGGSLQRTVDAYGNYVDDQAVINPFVPATTASPGIAWQQPPPPDPTDPTGGNDPGQIDDPGDGPQIDGPETLELTELLPNPASPATDTTDEFVEIHNYGAEAVNLAGFTIQTGSTFGYSYTITDGSLAPGAYTVFTSGDTPLALSNSGGKARLLNPGGQVIDESAAYDEASEGDAWALFGDHWQWTTSPTPGSANVLHVPIPAKKRVKKAKIKKARRRKAAKTRKSRGLLGALSSDPSNPAAGDQVPSLHPAVLAGVGGAALLYGAYEYRTDMANRLYQLRRYRATRRAARAAAKGA